MNAPEVYYNDAIVNLLSRMGSNVAAHVRDRMIELRRRLMDSNLNLGVAGYGIINAHDRIKFRPP